MGGRNGCAGLYLTVAAVVAILYAAAFLIISSAGVVVLQQLRGASCCSIFEVLRCGDSGMGADCMVCEEFSRLAAST
jgi:hypothetical protein